MPQPESRYPAAAAGNGMAAVLLILGGAMSLAQGFADISDDRLSAVVRYVYRLGFAEWGWIHIIIGALVLICGFTLFSGSVIARGVGVGLSVLMVLANFLYLPYQPFWSVIMIALGLFMIWSLFHRTPAPGR